MTGVEGHAVDGGLEITMAGDFVAAADTVDVVGALRPASRAADLGLSNRVVRTAGLEAALGELIADDFWSADPQGGTT